MFSVANTEKIRLIHREATGKSQWGSSFTVENARAARHFHETIPGYEKTPLVGLPNLAEALGVAAIHVKDESKRFGLNAFKALGGSYSIARFIGKELGIPAEDLTFDTLMSRDVQEKVRQITFVTATDGNHGRGIAWTAKLLGARAVVYMPKGSSPERLANIRALGAEAEITDLNYDDSVRLAAETAERIGGAMVQDTAWPGYEEIPEWIMQGYTTMGAEIMEQLEEVPTHIFLQAGVGAMAGGMTGFFADLYRSQPPRITIVEPDAANCVFSTAEANDGEIHNVTGSLSTIMAGLACGEPCTIGWSVLHAHAEFFASIPESVAASGMRILGAPLPGDPSIVSGESGAAAAGFVAEVLRRKEYQEYKAQLGLDENSRILCISTEGDTDQANYRRILWDGAWGSRD